VSSQEILLAILVFGLVATRLWEEGRWRSGRITDRTSALLVVARLPILALGFCVITGRDAGTCLVLLAASLALAALLYPVAVSRLRRVKRDVARFQAGARREAAARAAADAERAAAEASVFTPPEGS